MCDCFILKSDFNPSQRRNFLQHPRLHDFLVSLYLSLTYQLEDKNTSIMFLSVPPMASTSIIFIVLSITFTGGRAQPKQSSLINLGTSLTYPTSWLSSSSQFAFGFYQQGRGFAVGIWFVDKDNTTILWTTNRDDPPVTSKSMLDFTRDGKILLRTEQGQKQLIVTSATDPVSYAAMLDTGNFVLYDKDYKIIGQSFGYPIDTILGGQTLFTGGNCSLV